MHTWVCIYLDMRKLKVSFSLEYIAMIGNIASTDLMLSMYAIYVWPVTLKEEDFKQIIEEYSTVQLSSRVKYV